MAYAWLGIVGVFACSLIARYSWSAGDYAWAVVSIVVALLIAVGVALALFQEAEA